MAFEREDEFLVLGADPEGRLWPRALRQPIDELVAPLDRLQVDLITRHGIAGKWVAASMRQGGYAAALRLSGGKRP